MRKFFLIPLMTMLCTVMAWADPVTTLEELQAALNAGGEVTLGANINLGTSSVTLASGTATLNLGEFTLSSGNTGQKTSGVIKVTGGNLTINATTGGVRNTSANTKGNAVLLTGGSLTINGGAFHGTYEAIYASAGSININGGSFETTFDNDLWLQGNVTAVINNGTFTGAWCCFQVDNGAQLTINGGNISMGTPAMGAEYIFYLEGGSVLVKGGAFTGQNPIEYVDLTSRIETLSDGTYTVSAPAANVVAYNPSLLAAYTSLADAIDAASAGDEIYMHKNDASAISVNNSIMVKTNGYTTNLSAGAGYVRADMGDNIAFTDNAIAAFLMADGTNSMTIDANADISNAGTIHVRGNKTLTINEGVTVTYKRQGDLANIVVDNGAKLTMLGSGTCRPTASECAWDSYNGCRLVDNNGTLVIGVLNDANNCLKLYSTTLRRGSIISTNAHATTTINNVEIFAAMAATWNSGGNFTINGGRFISVSHVENGYNTGWYSYTLRNDEGGHTTINGGYFQGSHGCFDADDEATVDITGGTFHAPYGLDLTQYTGDNMWNAWEATGTIRHNFYAFFIATGAVANVYGGDFWSETPNANSNSVIALCGNNDAYNYYGIVNLYGGRWQDKVKVQARKNGDSYYPSSVPTTSAWYSAFNTYAPLPAGYEYYETGDATYRYGVRAIPGANVAEVESNDPTIPWQQNTTWDADWAGGADVVPEDNTIVSIPVGKTVVVDKNESETDAVAQQVFIAQDATLKVEDGTTLTVGEGGMNIGNGGKLIVEPGAIVKVGDAGIITTDNEALVIEATETDQAVLLYDPTVPQNENTQPQATVKLTTKSKMLNNSPFQYTYQRFALPIKAAATPVNDFDPAIHEYYDATEESYGFESYIYYWNSHNWANCNWSALVPFKGYQLANNSKNGGVVYTFKGNLIGNENGEYEFAEYGFDFFGNSYTAPINVETFLAGFGSDVEATIWLYNYGMSNWQQVSLEDFSDFGVDPEYQQIKSMDGFLLNLRTASGSANVNYNDAIWSNPLLGTTPSPAPARRAANSNLSNSAVITVTEANGHGDAVTLVEKATRSNEFENGADASKYMTENGLSLYAETNAGQLSRVATNDLSNTVLTFRAGNETNYSLTIDKAQGEDYILRDNVTGNTIAMTNGATYNFTQAANTTVPARFEVIGIAKMPTAIDNIEAAAKANGIYTVTGQFLGHDFTNLPAGVYVVNGVKIVK